MCTLVAEEDEEGERAQDGRERPRHLEHERPLLRAKRYKPIHGYSGSCAAWVGYSSGVQTVHMTVGVAHPLDTVALQAVHDQALDTLPLAVRQAPALQLSCTRIHNTRAVSTEHDHLPLIPRFRT